MGIKKDFIIIIIKRKSHIARTMSAREGNKRFRHSDKNLRGYHFPLKPLAAAAAAAAIAESADQAALRRVGRARAPSFAFSNLRRDRRPPLSGEKAAAFLAAGAGGIVFWRWRRGLRRTVGTIRAGMKSRRLIVCLFSFFD